MKRLLATLRDKWPEYLLEIIVLVVGIYGAFALDSWNENRLERKLEKKYLISLAADLNRDLEALQEMLEYRKNANQKSLELLGLKRIEASFEAQLSFSTELTQTLIWQEFKANDNTFQELTSSGNLSILSNDKIKNGLLDLDALNKEIIASRNHMRRDYEHYLYDEIFKFDQFQYIDYQALIVSHQLQFLTEMTEEELSELAIANNEVLNNPTVRNGLRLIILNNTDVLKIYDEMSLLITSLIDEISDQLNTAL